LAVAYAALRLTLRGELDRAAELAATAQEAQTALGTAHLWVHAAAGVLANFQGDVEGARRHAEAWAELARAHNDGYELAKALTLLAPALVDDPAHAGPVAEQAVQAARQVGAADALLYALLVQGLALTEQDLERALRSMQEAADVAASLGDRFGEAAAIAYQGGIALRRCDWQTALRTYAAGVEQHIQLGQPITDELIGVAIAFAGLGCVEPAGVIFGLAQTMSGLHLPTSLPADLVDSAEEAIVAAFDTEQLTQLKARGAALDLPSAVAYLRSEVDRILANGKDVEGAPA
jgi:hypothetical protein